MLQFCTKQVKTPYYIRAIDKNIYSLEELNYFIYNHMNMVYKEFFDENLLRYLEKELDQRELASTLRSITEQGGTVRDLIQCVLKESGYYSANDIAKVSSMIMSINSMTRDERMVIEAESCFREERYETALKIYSDILGSREEGTLPDTFYAKVAFAMGIIYSRLFMCKNANAYFWEAYELYPDPTYAKAGVYMSIINKDDEELLRAIIRYKISDEALAAIKDKIEVMRKDVLKNPKAKDFVLGFRENPEKQIEKWQQDYYGMLN